MENQTLEHVLERIGLADRWKARGEEWGRREEKTQIAQKMIKIGLPREQIVETTGLDLSTVESLMGTARDN